MKKMKWIVLLVTGLALTIHSQAQDPAAFAQDASALAEAVAEMTLSEAAGLLADVLVAISQLDVDSDEQTQLMETAIATVFGIFEGESNALAEALGDALGYGSAQLLQQVESVLGIAGFNAAAFSAAAFEASGQVTTVPPPISLEDPAPPVPSEPTPPPTPPEPPPTPPEPPPIAPPYLGQSLG